MQRARVLIALVVVAGLVAFLARHFARDDAAAPIDVRRGADAAVEPSARDDVPAKSKRPRARDVVPPPADDTPPAPTADAATSELDGASLFPPLVVEVRLQDGTWPKNGGGFAYALRAGASGADGAAAIADLRGDGTCELRLPDDGAYDVGAVGAGEFVWTLATDVDSRTTRRVALTMPETAEVRFVADPSGAKAAGTPSVMAADGPPRSATPGRGEVCGWSMGLNLAGFPTTWRARTDLALRVQRGGDPVSARPERFHAPAVVVVGAPNHGAYRLKVGVEPADRIAGPNGFIRYEFEIDGGGEHRRWAASAGTWAVPEGERFSDHVRFTLRQTPPAAHSILRWCGVGILPGETTIDVGDDGVVDVPVVLRLDESRPAPRSDFIVRVDGPPDARDVKLWVVVPDGGAEELHDIAALGHDQIVAHPPERTPFALVAAAKGFLSWPTPHVIGGRNELSLRPVGRLRIVRGVRPPDDVLLVLRRKDRLPLLAHETENDAPDVFSHCDLRLAVDLSDPAAIVGPLPEGDVAFVVSYRTTDLVEFTAHVVAGATTDVRLPLAANLRTR